VAGALVAAGITWRLATEVQRLLFEPQGPLDLLFLRGLIRQWFAGIPFYEDRGGIHPPAVFLLLWPLYGWGSEAGGRWVYALATVPVVAGFAWLLVREARPETGVERALLTILVIGCYPTAITIGNGQVTFFILFAALAGIFLFLHQARGDARDAALTGLFLIALVKPNLTLPFFWVIAFSGGWPRPAILAVVAYLLATAASVMLHGASLYDLHSMLYSWYARTEHGVSESGYGNVHEWFGDLGLSPWAMPASLVIFALHGLWAWRHRGADLWVLIGVAAIVARLWAYHRVYDDLLLIFPLIALYRLRRRPQPDRGAWALFVLGAAALAAPITPILMHATWALVAVWLLQLAYLMRTAALYRGVSVATGRISSSSETPPWRKAP
jgi:hypothetical protein